MIKLNKQVDALENILERLENSIDDLIGKQGEIEERAEEHDRDMTGKEQERYVKFQEKIEELEDERDAIESALDYLRDYVEE